MGKGFPARWQSARKPWCGVCGGSGWMAYYAESSGSASGIRILPLSSPDSLGFAIPCLCDTGKAVMAKENGTYSPSLQAVVFEKLTEPYRDEEDEEMTWREFQERTGRKGLHPGTEAGRGIRPMPEA